MRRVVTTNTPESVLNIGNLDIANLYQDYALCWMVVTALHTCSASSEKGTEPFVLRLGSGSRAEHRHVTNLDEFPITLQTLINLSKAHFSINKREESPEDEFPDKVCNLDYLEQHFKIFKILRTYRLKNKKGARKHNFDVNNLHQVH